VVLPGWVLLDRHTDIGMRYRYRYTVAARSSPYGAYRRQGSTAWGDGHRGKADGRGDAGRGSSDAFCARRRLPCPL